MKLSDAIASDVQGQTQEAAAAYEGILRSNPNELEATLNLMVLYWQATDFGISAIAQLPPEFVAFAGRRLRELLDLVPKQFPSRPEVVFWTKYIAWADLGVPFQPEECRDLLRDHPQYLEPALVLFSRSGGDEAESEAMQLLERCATERTARCRYMVSVIKGVLKRRRPKATG
jgi:hypothetical protein